MIDKPIAALERFGFSFETGGAHLARTMMLNDLQALLAYVDDPNVTKADYRRAIIEDNCLAKRSGRTRALSARHLIDLYALDPSVPLFRTLLFFWKRDRLVQPLLALLCAYARDPILRMSAPIILQSPEGTTFERETMEEYLDAKQSGRFSSATLKSAVRNISSSWTQSGHLTGRVRKIRSRAEPTPGAVAFALFLGYLSGARGQSLFTTEYAALLDCSFDRAIELAEDASRRGWIILKRVGNVIEVLFPQLISAQEMEWVRE